MSRALSTSKPSLSSDLKTAWRLLTTRAKGDTHADRLESFYKAQANEYDGFRARLLHGRDELFTSIPVPAQGHWVDLGAGTGENAERIGDGLSHLAKLHLVDMCPSLLQKASQRITDRGWTNVITHEADATTFDPGTPVDVVTFSYSLTMIPDWFAAIDRAYEILKPGGLIGVVDFYTARKHASQHRKAHGWFTRTVWPAWFANDNVFLSADHLPYLTRRFERVHLTESRGKIPFIPFARVPYYQFLGRKPQLT